jgi:hypothetical protein
VVSHPQCITDTDDKTRNHPLRRRFGYLMKYHQSVDCVQIPFPSLIVVTIAELVVRWCATSALLKELSFHPSMKNWK